MANVLQCQDLSNSQKCGKKWVMLKSRYMSVWNTMTFLYLTLPIRKGYCNWFGKMSVCLTLMYLKNWAFLDFNTWHVCTPPNWQERALTKISLPYKKGEKFARCGFFQSSRLFLRLMKHKIYITRCFNFQQSK